MSLADALVIGVVILAVGANASSEATFWSDVTQTNDAAPTSNKMFDKSTATMKALLTMDGGGLRGIITVEVLSVVESAIKKVVRSHPDQFSIPERGDLEVDLADYFVAMSGVNSGCWIASYLASKCGRGACKAVFDDRRIINLYGNIRPGSVDGLRVFFREFGPAIYHVPNMEWMSIDRLFTLPIFNIPGVFFSRHPSRRVEEILTMFLGQTDMKDLYTVLFIPTYDLIRKAAVLFVSGNFRSENSTVPAYTYVLETDDKPRDPFIAPPKKPVWQPSVKLNENKGYRLRDLAQAGGAAPIQHEAKRFSAINDESFEFYCIDGSLMANNPTFQTVIFMVSNYDGQVNNVSVLSIGTGITGGAMNDRANSGAYQWMFQTNDFFTVVMDGGSELIQAQIDMFFYFVLREGSSVRRNQYLRVQTSADEARPEGRVLAEVDDVRLIEELTQIGKQTANNYRDSIDDFVEAHIFGLKLSGHKFSGFVARDPVLYSRTAPRAVPSPSPAVKD